MKFFEKGIPVLLSTLLLGGGGISSGGGLLSAQSRRHPPVIKKEVSLDQDIQDLTVGTALEKRFAIKSIRGRIEKCRRVLKKGERADELAREEALIRLDEIRDRTFLPLIGLLGEEGLRKDIIRILGDTGDRRALPFLEKVLEEEEARGKKGRKLVKLVKRAMASIKKREEEEEEKEEKEAEDVEKVEGSVD